LREGAAGDASHATAEKGRRAAEHHIDGFIAVLHDMTAFPLHRLHAAHADPFR
jgi:creatinine amidohydrolase/Fe(II)-dependent formamide hydrolase-like protein